MINTLQFFLFTIFSIYAFVKSLSYALYEIKTNDNKFGGIFIIIFALTASILAIYSFVRN